MLWPTWLDDAGVQAKSPEMGGETLAQHTWAVLNRLADQVRLRPQLPALLGERIWHRLYWGCFLHDFGKAATGFQERLRRVDNVWKEQHHRHEALSLAFVDWFFPKGHIDREWVTAVIAFHHKDASAIIAKYGGDAAMREMDPTQRELVEEALVYLGGQIDTPTAALLWRWADTCALDWARTLQIPLAEAPVLMAWEQASRRDPAKGVFQALLSYNRWLASATQAEKKGLILCRGLILTADHAASAGVEPFPDMPLTAERARRPLGAHALRDHQVAAMRAPRGSAIMIAPTGSGKTEAALLWSAAQINYQPAARLFYTLPYQASMNAMRDRLASRVFGRCKAEVSQGIGHEVTVLHSRALLKAYQDYMSLDESSPREALRVARQLRNLAQLNFFPIQVFSPYQMLKAAYSLKGYEALLLDYAGGLFIFDEIHAYDTKRVALILAFMAWLRKHFDARFLVMTATLPPPLRRRLQTALDLGAADLIQATPQEFQRSQRHTVHLLAGTLQEQILQHVKADWQAGRSVLICLNRVGDAQSVYRLLRDSLGLRGDVGMDGIPVPAEDVEIVLLHSRFNGADRNRKEDILLARAGVGRKRAGATRPFICIATQVVEVSLDVDFDCLYTAPAPLEAMLQRFGRVNRGRKMRELCPVYVFTEPAANDGKVSYLPYQEDMVQASIDVLRRYCRDGPIEESLVTTMLGDIYTGAILTRWEQEYDETAKEFERDVLAAMQPCQSAERALYEQFYRMFDGREVLPVTLLDPYFKALDTEGYFAANRFLVNISNRQYQEFYRKGLIKPARDLEGEYADHIHVEYSAERGLDLDGARQADMQEDDE